MIHARVAGLLALLSLGAVALAQAEDKQQERIYDIRDLVEKADSLAFSGISEVTFKPTLALPGRQAEKQAAAVVAAFLSALDRDAGKPTAVDGESIQLLNGTRLVVRSSATRHAAIADMLRTVRRLNDLSVVVKAQLYETDQAFYTRLKQSKRVSLEELEGQQTADPPRADSLFKLLEKQKLILASEEIKMDNGQEAALLSRQQAICCGPSPEQARKGEKVRQTVWEGVSFHAAIRVSPDRRSVNLKLSEKAAELQEIVKVKESDPRDRRVEAEIPYVLESATSQVLEIPDGGSILIPVQYRPRSAQEKERRWVLSISPRIVIPEEEQIIRLDTMRSILPKLVADVLNNPRLKTTRDFYGTPGDKRFALVNSSGWTWPKDLRPEVPGFEIAASKRDGQRLLGIRVDSIQDGKGEHPGAAIAVTLVNAGGSANGAVLGGCTIHYTARPKEKNWAVELSEPQDR